MSIGKDEAERIAKKLDAEIEEKPKHKQVIIRHEGQAVALYGIRRASKRDTSHSYVSKQIHVTQAQAESLARCSLSKDDYFNILRERKIITDPPKPQD